MNTEQCDGYKNLLDSVEIDEQKSPNFHDYRAKLKWVVERANHYAEKTGLRPADILDAWEKARTYWYMNYYQDANMPLIKGDDVRVFETEVELRKSVGTAGFRCPMCNAASDSPYECDSGAEMSKGKVCDWKSYGLLGTLGKGVFVYVKSRLKGQSIFRPIAWEAQRLEIATLADKNIRQAITKAMKGTK